LTLKVLHSSLVVQVRFSSIATCNCSELRFLDILLSVRLSSFRLKSSFMKPPAENHLLQVFSFTTHHFHKCF
ncbi:unnamed protein product, partial [Hymenolepis diminuta]